MGDGDRKLPLEKHLIFGRFAFLVGRIPDDLATQGRVHFDEYWCLRPKVHHLVRQPGTGQFIPLPRWQQAYERAYAYTGSVNRALPLPTLLRPYLTWAQQRIDGRLNGVLVNWYDAAQGQYIGPHRDSRQGLIADSAVVTISLGAERCFRLTRKGERSVDFRARHGSVFVVPWATNLGLKHAVPKPREGDDGRRMSVTLRAFS